VFRLLQTGLGDQAGWLLGFAVVAGGALLLLTRLRRRDPNTGWLIAVGGAFLVTAVVFSFASGIFHPYYVSFLAPFVAALLGAGVGQMLPASLGGVGRGGTARVVAPLAIGAGAVTELVVLGETGGALSWAVPVVITLGGATAALLALRLTPRLRAALIAVALAALLAAPTTWAAETLGHATSSTFPTGGPASASVGGPGGGTGRFGRGPGGGAGRFGGGAPGGGIAGLAGVAGGGPSTGFAPPAAGGTFARPPAGGGAGGAAGGGGGGPGAGGGGGLFGGDSATLTAATRYAATHGGGTIGVSSQSSAATAILSSNANIAGLGGFSGRESSVTASWLAAEVRSGHLRWLLVDSNQGAALPGDTRTGSQTAFDVAQRVGRAVTVTTSGATKFTMYDLQGRASAILIAAGLA
jgi:hypothetical protein